MHFRCRAIVSDANASGSCLSSPSVRCTAKNKRDMNDQNARERIVELVTESQGKSGKVWHPAACRTRALHHALKRCCFNETERLQELDELFKTYYSSDAVLDHVALSVKGRSNIKKACHCIEAIWAV